MEKLTHFKIGQIVNTQGLKGEVRVYPFTDDIYILLRKRFRN